MARKFEPITKKRHCKTEEVTESSQHFFQTALLAKNMNSRWNVILNFCGKRVQTTKE